MGYTDIGRLYVVDKWGLGAKPLPRSRSLWNPAINTLTDGPGLRSSLNLHMFFDG